MSLTYADDTAIIASAKQHRAVSTKLRNAMQKVNRHLIKWHIGVNIDKTQLLFVPFDRKRKRVPNSPLTIGDIDLTYSRCIRYLGVYFDSKLSYHPHIDKLRARAFAVTRSLYPMTAPKALNRDNRSLLTKQVLWPSISYAAAACADAPKSALIRLRRSYSRAAKSMLRLPRLHPTDELYSSVLRQPLLEDYVMSARQRMINQIADGQNPNLITLSEATSEAWPT